MSKFLNKKEQVFDLKLTNYGNYLLSIGSFKPTYYAFFDDNVIYDIEYVSGSSAEAQNDIHKRIREETQYIESLVLFEDVDRSANQNKGQDQGAGRSFFDIDITPTKIVPRKDVFKFDAALGDAFLDASGSAAPAWKVVVMQSAISSSNFLDTKNNTKVPQINISASYNAKIVSAEDYNNENFNSEDPRKFETVSRTFGDGNVVYLETQDVLIYFDEVNTQILTENFDIEVFLVDDGATPDGNNVLKRKYFQNIEPQIVNDFMVSPTQIVNNNIELDSTSVENYFSILRDIEIDAKVACRAANDFNKDSYYIDIDFDCDEIGQEDLFFDIYGPVTEAEICQT